MQFSPLTYFMFADIVFPQRRYQIFTYRIPARLHGQLQVGSRVLVPLGRASAQGLIFAFSQDFLSHSGRMGLSQHKIREISELIDTSSNSTLDPTLMKLASLVGDYYLAPPGAALRLILPPVSSRRTAKRMVLTDMGRQALEQSRLSDEQAAVLLRLAKKPKGLTMATLLKVIDGDKAVMTGLKRRKFIQEIEWVRADAEKAYISQDAQIGLVAPVSEPNHEFAQSEGDSFLTQGKLFDESSLWWNRASTALSRHHYDEILLHASQEIRERDVFKAIQKTLGLGRTVLVLCPEVQQVTRIVEILQARWGTHVVEYHGDLSAQGRSQAWHEIQGDPCRVVVGTRMAVFVPLRAVGLIWVDQEEDSSFQEEQSPYYHAREVARMRAKLEAAVLVLGSSHPSLETFHRVGHDEDVKKLQVTNCRTPVTVEIVNLREVPYGAILSPRMMKAIQGALEAKRQAVVFLNRKGFSRSLTCKDCGYVPQCTTCGVVLILYQKPGRMRCSYCGSVHAPPEACPSCQSVRLEATGYGTERVEALIREKFPDATVARFDRETVKTPLQQTVILEDVQKKMIDIVIGTEMLFRVQSLPPMQCVGMPNADGGLHFPDFRSAERTYHRLMEALQLVDETSSDSTIIIQTLLPSHHVIRSVAQRDSTVFYQEELQIRQELQYPPYSLLIHIAISGKLAERVKSMALKCRERLVVLMAKGGAQHSKDIPQGADGVLGPLLSSRQKSLGLTRYILIVKEVDLEHGQSKIKRMRDDLATLLKRDRLMMDIKVNPADMN